MLVLSAGTEVLCDTPVCYTEIRHIHASETFDGFAQSHTETVLCIVAGNLHIKTPDGTPMANAMLSLMHSLGMDDMKSFGDSTGALALG